MFEKYSHLRSADTNQDRLPVHLKILKQRDKNIFIYITQIGYYKLRSCK